MLRKRFVFGAAAGIAMLVGAAMMWPRRGRRRAVPVRKPPASTGRRTAPVPAGKPPPPAPKDEAVAATVNGEPIYRRDVEAGIDRGMFPAMLDQARKARLNRLIDMAAVRQYLEREKVRIPDKTVEEKLAEMKRNPPTSAGCSCCRYESLEAFLEANLLTTDDLRALIHNDLGLSRHVDDLWGAEHPAGEKRRAFLERERPRIERTYFKLAHVFFNVFQQPEYAVNPDKVTARAFHKAREAQERLRKGEPFAAVAKSCSEDQISGPQGGELGCIPRSAFGPDIEQAAGRLQPGQTSPPVESAWGVHILRRRPLDDDDVLAALRSEHRDRKLQEIWESIRAGAKIVYVDAGGGRRPVPTPGTVSPEERHR